MTQCQDVQDAKEALEKINGAAAADGHRWDLISYIGTTAVAWICSHCGVVKQVRP